MINEKCKNCPELVIPYSVLFAKPNPSMPEEYKIGTCRCNVDSLNRKNRGYCGWCHSDECHGKGHRYYFEHIKKYPYMEIKFID